MSTNAQRPDGASFDIAVIGMGCRLPGADDPEAFWRNLREGVESVTFYSEEELAAKGIPAAVIQHPRYVRASAQINEPECFDAEFFGYVAREAQVMDPQHRIFLECAYHALEDAGYDPNRYPGLVGVYGGSTINTYILMNLMGHGEMLDVVGDLPIMIGNDKEYLATRVAYKLNLKGPAFAIQTACSSSLVSIHVACQAILGGECDIAIAGGSSVRMPVGAGYFQNAGGTSSPDGHCRAFDARSAGSVMGNGAGAVVLKYLSDALRDGDHIYAVIKGSAINNDGNAKVSFSAPSVEGQSRAAAAALAAAGMTGDDITYVEAHGTGTPMGDPIEVAALTTAFRQTSTAVQGCALGSVKTNIGHLDAAAGVASFIKTVQCLRHKMIPPTLHFEKANPEIDFAKSPFYVNSELSDWEVTSGGPRRAGVHSLGMGGTNAHVIVEEPPAAAAAATARPWQVLLLSAKTSSALDKQTAKLGQWLREHPQANLADVAYTLQVGRIQHQQRRAVVVRDIEDAVSALGATGAQRVITREAAGRAELTFMFPGQGAQFVGMAAQLYGEFPEFAKVVDECVAVLGKHMATSVFDVVFKPKDVAAAEKALTDTAVTQPALFVVEYALARLLMSWGITPQAMIGHSVGEYVAACLAGVFKLPDALALIAARGRLLSKLPGGSMLSVPLSEAATAAFLEEGLSIAAVNGPELVTVAGPTPAIERLATRLADKRVESKALVVSHAFHSSMMDPALDEFRAVIARIELSPPQIPFVSNLTGKWIDAAQATDREYWTTHIRSAVRFGPGLLTLAKEPGRALLEVGPGTTLSTLAKQYRAEGQWSVLAQTVRAPKAKDPDRRVILNGLAEIWSAGVEVDWAAIAGEGRLRLSLPTYPFERKRYWIDAAVRDSATVAANAAIATVEPEKKHGGPESWIFEPAVRALPSLVGLGADLAGVRGARVLVFRDDGGVADAVVTRLRAAGANVTTVTRGEAYSESGTEVTVAAASSGDWDKLFARLDENGASPEKVLFLWGLDEDADASFEAASAGFYALVELYRALGKATTRREGKVRVHVFVQHCVDVTGDDPIRPARALALGPCRVARQETRQYSSHVVELDPRPFAERMAIVVDQVIAEAFAAEAPPFPVVYRGTTRFRPSAERVTVGSTDAAPKPRKNGVYLIVGGLGLIGSTFAEHLLARYGATVVLFDTADPNTARVQGDRLGRLRNLGGKVEQRRVNAADAASLRTAVTETVNRHGRLDGVIYGPGAPTIDSVRALYELDRTTCELQFETKVHGIAALEEALAGFPLDFCMIVSSLSTFLGGIGSTAYAASNFYLDAFTRLHNRRHPEQPWLGVSWEHWLDPNDGEGHGDDVRAAYAVTPDEAVALFELVLGRPNNAQLAISTADLDRRIVRAAEREAATPASAKQDAAAPETAKKAAAAGATTARRNVGTPFVPARDDLERELVAAWSQILGIEQIGVKDNFFHLGGDSLMAMQMVSRLRDRYSVALPMTDLFAAPTIEGLAGGIRGGALRAATPSASDAPPPSVHALAPKPDVLPTTHDHDGEADDLESILAEVEGMSESEIETLLASGGANGADGDSE